MKFGKEIALLAIPEWKSQYIQYDYLKGLIDEVVQRQTKDALSDLPYDSNCPFIRRLERNVITVDSFCKETENSLFRCWNAVRQDLDSKDAPLDAENESSWFTLCSTAVVSQQQHQMEELYLAIDKLNSFKSINMTAVRKILKKYDKNMGVQTLQTLLPRYKTMQCFQETKVLSELELDVIKYYALFFTRGDRRRAMQRLRVPEQRFQHLPWLIFASGLQLGVAVLAIIVIGVVVSNSEYSSMSEARKSALFRIFRGLFILAMYPLCLAVNFYTFSKFGVNFRLLMGYSQRNVQDFRIWQTLLATGSFTLAVWAVVTIIFVCAPFVNRSDIAWAPAITLVCIVTATTSPLRSVLRRTIPEPLQLLGRIILAPYYEVHFADFWTADQLTSLVRPILDVEFMVYYLVAAYNADTAQDLKLSKGHLIGRACLASLPFTWRALQCIRRYKDQTTRVFHPHLTNMCKYCSSLLVVWMSSLAELYKGDAESVLDTEEARGFFAAWIISAIGSTIFTLTWDFRMDWGIMRHGKLLRPKIVYPAYFFYFAIVFNILGRIAWVLSVSVGFFNSYQYNYLDFALALLEVFRRTSWNFFRFEVEHLFNCGKLRATRIEVVTNDENEEICRSEHGNEGLAAELLFPGFDVDTDFASRFVTTTV